MDSDILGVEDVIKLFEEVGNAPKKVLTTATKKGANIALNYAKAHCPESVDGSHGAPPGTLKRSLKIKIEKSPSGKAVFQVGPGPEGWYAHFVDYGFTDKDGVYWQGNRFLRDAIDKNRDTIDETIINEMGKELDKLV